MSAERQRINRGHDRVNLGKNSIPALIGAAFFFLLTAAAAAASLVALPLSQYPDFQDDLQLEEFKTTLDMSLSFLRTVPASTCYTVAGASFPVQRLIDSALFFQELLQSSPSPEQLNQQIQRAYAVYRLDNDQDAGSRRMLITGYYQPVFKGSLTSQPPYVHPLYAVPAALVVQKSPKSATQKKTIGRLQNGRRLPFWTRKEIESGNLLRGQEMVWLQDPFDVFVLHIQGSGLIQLTDQTVRGVHYAQSNGRDYRSIGKYMVDSGRMKLADVNMDSIRLYLANHPEERDLIFHQNDSFIFFHWSKPGPAIGNLGRELTAGRSIAADQQWYPPGALAFVDSSRPLIVEGAVVAWKRMQRFVSVQDTGSALTGPNRVDIFWGTGEQAGMEAGRMKEEGNVYLLVLKEGVRPQVR